MYGQPVVSNPVSNPVIYGRFPRYIQKKSPAEKINKFLSAVSVVLVVLSLVSYYFVSDCQKTMNTLGREIVALSNENIELQNRLDNLNSFNNVDAMVHGSIAKWRERSSDFIARRFADDDPRHLCGGIGHSRRQDADHPLSVG